MAYAVGDRTIRGRTVAPLDKMIGVAVTTEEFLRFKSFCESNDISLSETVRGLVRAQLKKHGLLEGMVKTR